MGGFSLGCWHRSQSLAIETEGQVGDGKHGGRLPLTKSPQAEEANHEVVGDPDTQRIDTSAGAAVARLASGGHVAQRGELLLDAQTVALRAGRTFQFTAHGPQGLLGGKQAVVVTTRGSDYSVSHMAGLDFQETYMRTVLGFLGFDDVHFITCNGMDAGNRERAMHEGRAAVGKVVAEVAEALGAHLGGMDDTPSLLPRAKQHAIAAD